MKRYVNLINTGILGLLLLIPSYASALNVGTDWTNTDKNLNTTGSITGDDITATGKITPSAEGVLYNQGGNNAVDTTIETKLSTQVVNISDYSRNNKNDLKRLKGRLIGKNGKAKEMIQDLTNVSLSIYGKTISMIGKIENVDTARHAINNLLSGSRHGKVYAYLERQRKLKIANLE